MSTRERIMEEINLMPEDDVILMLRMWNNFITMEQERAREKQAPSSPWDVLRKYHKSVHVEDDFDYKAELARYRDEKYANPVTAAALPAAQFPRWNPMRFWR